MPETNKKLEIIKMTLRIWDGDYKTGAQRQNARLAAESMADHIEHLERTLDGYRTDSVNFAAKINRLESELAETSENLRRRNAETTRLKHELSANKIVYCIKCEFKNGCEQLVELKEQNRCFEVLFCSAGVEEVEK